MTHILLKYLPLMAYIAIRQVENKDGSLHLESVHLNHILLIGFQLLNLVITNDVKVTMKK